MKSIIASILIAVPCIALAALPGDVESLTIPYAATNAVSCGALQVCDLEFQPGEIITDFKISDAQNWSINPAVTGDDSKKVHHLIVMPVTTGLKTPLQVKTDRRAYEVMLESNSNVQASRKIAFSHQPTSDKISDISKLKSYVAESPAELAIPSKTAEARPVAAPQPKTEKPAAPAPLKTWALKPEHRSVRDVIEDWASTAGDKGGYEVIWETRDFPLSIKQVKTISTGDFWEALRILGEAYRNSDAPFQIQPTAFQQIVVVPMNKAQR